MNALDINAHVELHPLSSGAECIVSDQAFQTVDSATIETEEEFNTCLSDLNATLLALGAPSCSP